MRLQGEPTAKERIRAAIKRHGTDGISAGQLATLFRCDTIRNSWIKNVVTTLKKTGEITSPRRGHYVWRQDD